MSTARFAGLAARFAAFRPLSANGTAATVIPEVESDPRDANVTLTKGHLDALTERIAHLEFTLERMQHTEAHAVRRLFLLVKNVGKLLKANNVSTGEPVGNDRVRYTLANDDGAWLELIIDVFHEVFVIIDANGIMADKLFHFGEQTDLNYDTILMLTGYAALAARKDPADSAEFWTSALDDELKLLTDNASTNHQVATTR